MRFEDDQSPPSSILERVTADDFPTAAGDRNSGDAAGDSWGAGDTAGGDHWGGAGKAAGDGFGGGNDVGDAWGGVDNDNGDTGAAGGMAGGGTGDESCRK